jgi:protein TonB
MIDREHPRPADSSAASPPDSADSEGPARGSLSSATRQRLMVRGLPISTLAHLFAILAAFAFLGELHLVRDDGTQRNTELLALVEEADAVQLIEEIIEPPPELDVPEPALEPELVEGPFVPDELPPDEPAPELPDWLPPIDPLSRIEDWKRLPPVEVEIQVSPQPPPEPLPEPAPVAPVDIDADMPEVLESYEPSYPRKAVRLGLGGTVRLRITVNASGLVTRVEVLSSSGHKVLDEAAARAFERWVFRPRAAGEPEVRRFEKPFTYRPRENSYYR